MREVKRGEITPRFLTQSTTFEIILPKIVDFLNTWAVREKKYELP